MRALLKHFVLIVALRLCPFAIKTVRMVTAWPSWIKIPLWLLLITVFATVASTMRIFTVNRPALVGIIGLQIGIAAYLLSVSRHDHADRIELSLREAFDPPVTDDKDAEELLIHVVRWTLRLPQVYAAYVLLIDVLITPAVLLRNMYIENWIIVMLIWCMLWLGWSTLILRVDMLAPVVSGLRKRLERFFEGLSEHDRLFIVGGFIVLVLFFGSMSSLSATVNPNPNSRPTGNSESNGPSDPPGRATSEDTRGKRESGDP